MSKLNLDNELYQIMHPRLRELAVVALDEAPEYFWTMPASRNHHHPSERKTGGTVLHIKRAFIVAKHLCRAYSLEGFSREIILTAVLLHDICKAGISDKGAGHTVGGHERLLEERYEKVPVILRNEYWNRVNEMVMAHEGRWGEKKPKTLGERIVHLADYIASRSDILVLTEED
jgi:HD superfamily phosphodiesterase